MKRRSLPLHSILIFCLLPGAFFIHPGSARASENEYLDMDISQLMQVTITSVSKRPQTLLDAAAAVYVITQEDIHSAGVTTIPEALRMAPGLQVARISSSKWAISSRGLNGNFSNKLLVLIDGRTVYTPGFSGTYWDMQHTLLKDIDRIEVIRGPGAAMWGANAVNGVINIITKGASQTQGGYTEAGLGTEEKVIGGFRYGTSLGDSTDGRAYLTYNERDSFSMSSDGTDANDEWNSLNGGFRIDGVRDKQSEWTLQGDGYVLDEDQMVEPYRTPTPPYQSRVKDETDGSGWNILGRWKQHHSKNTSWTLQTYFDYVNRDEIYAEQTYRTFDADFQYDTWLGKSNNITLGFGYRNIDASYGSTFMISVDQDEQNYDLYSGFIQDVITLLEDEVWLTIGTKWEHNDFTDHELQPTARIMWKPSDTTALWASISRAVRTPSPVENYGQIVLGVDPRIPPYPRIFTLSGNSDFESEEVIAYETGYRWFPSTAFSLDLALFYNEYDDLLGIRPVADPLNFGNLEFSNEISGDSYGMEIVADWKPNDWLNFVFTYAYLYLNFSENNPEIPQLQVEVYEESAPSHQISLRGTADLFQGWQANIWLRYVDELKAASTTAQSLEVVVDDYMECDLTLSWKPKDNLEFLLVGQNLFNSEHLEFVSEFFQMPVEVERNVHVKVMFKF